MMLLLVEVTVGRRCARDDRGCSFRWTCRWREVSEVSRVFANPVPVDLSLTITRMNTEMRLCNRDGTELHRLVHVAELLGFALLTVLLMEVLPHTFVAATRSRRLSARTRQTPNDNPTTDDDTQHPEQQPRSVIPNSSSNERIIARAAN